MSEVAVTDRPTDVIQPKPIREVDSSLFSKLVTPKQGTLEFNEYSFRTTIPGKIAGIRKNEEFNRDDQLEEVAKLASDAFTIRHDAKAAAMAIAIYTKSVSLDDIVPDGKIPNSEQRAKALEMEQVMREEIIRRARLPEDFFEANGYLKAVR